MSDELTSEDDPSDALSLSHVFADEFPELGVPWRATRPTDPRPVIVNDALATALGFDPDALRSDAGVRSLFGDLEREPSPHVAQVYAGHQFGTYSARLGDGRALLLGERADAAGRLVDVHLKGSGPTPFARADGYAALGPMLREYLISEAMHALGVPTSRALAVVTTGRRIPRDGELAPGALLVRVAASHLRVGTFQYARSTGDRDLLERLTRFAVQRHFPGASASTAALQGESPPDSAALAETLLTSVTEAQASLIAQWMLVGFVHGVMNTDNMTISGETIDYGPCAFIDAYDPAAVFSSIDHMGRYAYGAQPDVGLWNLTRFAESLLPLLGDDAEAAKDRAVRALGAYWPAYDRAWLDGMRAKLGLEHSAIENDALMRIAASLLAEAQTNRLDYTSLFRSLAAAALHDGEDGAGGPGGTDALSTLYGDRTPGDWYQEWREAGPDGTAMLRANPMTIPRNHTVAAALDQATDGDLTLFNDLLEAVTNPYEEREEWRSFAHPDDSGIRHVTTCGT